MGERRATHGRPAPRRTYRTRIRWFRVARVLVAVAAIVSALGYASPESPSPAALSSPTAAPPVHATRSDHGRALGEADGAVPDGTTVFDDRIPGVAKLDADLLAALRRAAADAADDGVELLVDGGWRSSEYQEHLLRQAVSKYGSEAEAARWVATPETSAHVSGDAVDLAPSDATAWLSEHGSEYELCQIYGNEPWHFELRPEALDGGCPPTYADPTQDPRLQH